MPSPHLADGEPVLVHRRDRAEESGVAEAHPVVMFFGHKHDDCRHALQVDVPHVIEHPSVVNAPVAARFASDGNAAAMKPFGKEIGVADVALGDSGRLGEGVAFFEKTRRHVGQRASLDFRHSFKKPLVALERVEAAD